MTGAVTTGSGGTGGRVGGGAGAGGGCIEGGGLDTGGGSAGNGGTGFIGTGTRRGRNISRTDQTTSRTCPSGSHNEKSAQFESGEDKMKKLAEVTYGYLKHSVRNSTYSLARLASVMGIPFWRFEFPTSVRLMNLSGNFW